MLPLPGIPPKTRWMRLDDMDPVEDTLRHEAHDRGAAFFSRDEGA